MVPSAALAKLPKAKALVEALLPYAEKHFERIDRLLVGTKFVGYVQPSHRQIDLARYLDIDR